MLSFSLWLRVRSWLKRRSPAGMPGSRWPWRFRKPVGSRLRVHSTSREGRNYMIRKAALQIGVPALLAFIAWNAYLAVNHLKRVQTIAALTIESSAIQAELSGVAKDVTNMETGQRGYLLTGNPEYLQPYADSKGR